MKSICYEHQASAAIDTARVFWKRADDAVATLEWTLVRDPGAGVPLIQGSPIRVVKLDGAKSIGLPTILCTYEVTGKSVIFHDLEFS